MIKHKLDLMVKLLTLPFTEFDFFNKDVFEELSKKKAPPDTIDYKDYLNYYNEIFLKEIYKVVYKRQNLHNLDEIKLLVQMIYSDETLQESYKVCGSNSLAYLKLISDIARAFISQRDGKIVIKYWESGNEADFLGPYKGINKIALWNSLNRMLSVDLLICSYLLDNDMLDVKYLEGNYSQVVLEELQLEKILQKGVAETHLHAKAGINFYVKWQELMDINIKSKKMYEENLFHDILASEDNELQEFIKMAAFLRIIMADYVENYSEKMRFREDYIENFDVITNVYIGEKWGFTFKEFIESVADGIFEGLKFNSFKYAAAIRDDFVELFDNLKSRFEYIEEHDEIRQDDILSRGIFLKYSMTVDTTMENIFIFKCLSYIKANVQDKYFSKLFWQYLRIKNELFQLNVQSNMLQGLDLFQSYYNRSTYLSYDSQPKHWYMILKTQLQNNYLKKLELRIAPPNTEEKVNIKRAMKKTLLSIFKAYERIIEEKKQSKEIMKAPVAAIGIVYHFIKKSDWYMDKCWFQCKKNSDKLYFEKLRKEYGEIAAVINELRLDIPFLSQYIVGIDAASIENNTEPWVFAPIYRKLRNSQDNKLINNSSCEKVKTIGLTFHAGEDFRHILTGLRRIDEVIEHLRFRAGDRIGHGIALGIDIDKWAANNRIVVMPKIEYLHNLLWLWGVYKDGRSFHGMDMEYLEKEILEIALSIYSRIDGITVFKLWRVYINKFQEFSISEKYDKSIEEEAFCDIYNNDIFCSQVDKSKIVEWSEEKLIYSYHCKQYLHKMQQPILVDVGKYGLDMLKEVQKLIATKISREGIIIETNPTSNVAIGELDSIFNHYIHKLNNRGLEGSSKGDNSLIISINSDDPCVFNTNVNSEIAYIFYSLLEKGYAREEILTWIDKVREYGMQSSFISNDYTSIEVQFMEVKTIIDALTL